MSAPNLQQAHLPPKAKYQRSHKRSIQQQLLEEEDFEQPESSGDEEEPRLGWTVGQHSTKQLKLATSVADGVGHPRKPRIGPEYQAAIPELPICRPPPYRQPPGPAAAAAAAAAGAGTAATAQAPAALNTEAAQTEGGTVAQQGISGTMQR
uniref:ELM2 domain-containing protein n=1 Tax=Tetradesmus obliquus TaxID=3088 RepID=A0A383VMC3_TETOB|eukprot:jgi/Sobl393_1/10510/SZX65969.1